MNRIIDLQTALLDLLQKVHDSEIRLIAGGGFGIYLKTDHVRKSGMRTLLVQWPEPRSTNDLDLFLRPELLIESSKLRPLVSAIAKLGYQVVPGAEKYQFAKPGPGGTDVGGIKIDILTGPQSRFHGTRVKADTRRARPKPSVGTVVAMGTSALTAIEISLHCGEKMSRSVGMQRKKAEPEFVLGGLQAKNFAYQNYRYPNKAGILKGYKNL